MPEKAESTLSRCRHGVIEMWRWERRLPKASLLLTDGLVLQVYDAARYESI